MSIVKTRWQMSAAEVERAGTAFAKEPYNCAVFDWRYSPTLTLTRFTTAQQTAIHAFDDRSDVTAAFTRVLAAAKARSTTRCQ